MNVKLSATISHSPGTVINMIFFSQRRFAPKQRKMFQKHDLLLKDFCLRWCLSVGVCGRAASVCLQKSGSYLSPVVADTLMDRGAN